MLLSHKNVNQEKLQAYAREAANFSTNGKLPHLDFALNHYGQSDVAMFDFTSLFQAEYAARIIDRNGHRLLLALVGDSLLEVRNYMGWQFGQIFSQFSVFIFQIIISKDNNGNAKTLS